jgi:hypothetical protein
MAQKTRAKGKQNRTRQIREVEMQLRKDKATYLILIDVCLAFESI